MISQLDLMIAVQTVERLAELDRKGRLHQLTASTRPNRRHSAPGWPEVTAKITAFAHLLRWSAPEPQTAHGGCAQP